MNLLEENLKLKLLPASHYDAIPFQELRMFCHYQARYLLPTVELIEFLKPYTKNALHKPIMKAKHQKIDAPFVRSRRQDNKIWIWNG